MQVSFKPIVHRHRQRKDNNYSVIIRIGFKSKYAFIETDYSISKNDLNRSGEIKNKAILDKCNVLIKKYRDIVDSNDGVEVLSVQDIKQIINDGLPPKSILDFAAFFRQYVNNSKNSPSISIYSAAYNHLTKFSGTSIMVNSITPKFLSDFEKYLSGKMGSRGVNLYLSTLRMVYNLIIDEYEYKGYEFRYPFRKYKIPKAKYPTTTALTKNQLTAIINAELKGVLANRVRDIFVISLLTLGTNAKDLYLLESISPRIEYKRSKTKSRRDDEAFISIHIEPELMPYLEKYKGIKRALKLSEIYSNTSKLNEGLRRGLKQVVKQINEREGEGFIDHLDFYDARRTMASIMRNKLGISKDDVAMCLNHVDQDMKITDQYIEKDWSVIDRANKTFIDWLFDKTS